tara:strand:- start:2454 stop:4796 length:2343 start_codon:yes stop_codon:yes gene_type:complete
MLNLRPCQLEAVVDILDKKKILIADDMGFGKCAEAISAKTALENRLGYDINTLVSCPSSVTEHWEDEARKWYKKRDQTKSTIIQTQNYGESLEQARNSDFVIVDYPTLSALGDSQSAIDKFSGMGFKYGIIDEVHNAKNPESIRSMSVKSLFDSMEYLTLLSGTPVPNSVLDIYMLLSLLDKDTFPIDSTNPRALLSSFYNTFREDPEFVSRLLNDRMLRRTTDEYLHTKFPELRQRDLEVFLEGEHRDIYLQVYENDDIKPGSKLWQLIKASIDPNLVNPRLLDERLRERIGRMESSVYDSLDNLVEEVVDNNGKVLLFSDLKEGVIEKLGKRFSKYGAVLIDGDVSSKRVNGDLSAREEIRKKFQNNSDCKILLSTTVMDEGVDLTAATDLVHLTLPYTPSAFDQRNRRAQRIGEIDKDYVNVHVVKPRLGGLTPIITDGVQRLLDDKRRIIDYLLHDPFSITEKDLDEIKNGNHQKSKHLVPLIASPTKAIFSHFAQLKMQGGRKISQHYNKYSEEAENIARLYASHWEGYYGGNTANLYTKVIRAIEENGYLEKILDIASGPFSLSRKLERPIVNLDLNQHMLNTGRILEEQEIIVPGNTAVEGFFNELPFIDESFDLALCSLALHMSKVRTKSRNKIINEREQALREMNRVLKPEGYGIITLPHTLISPSDEASFYRGLGDLGFEVLPFSGFYRGPKDSKFKVYMAGLRKKSEPCEEALDESALQWKMDKKLSKTTSRTKDKREQPVKEQKETKKEITTDFYHTRNGKSVEEMIR